jgi:hypothetical protein
MKRPAGNFKPQGSAHAPIRGYLYQSCLAALRWLHLGRHEVIVFEGDQDIDRYILHRDLRIYEQVKDWALDLSVRHESVRKTLAKFVISYATLRERTGERRCYVFTTTARFRPTLRTSGVDILADWNEKDKRPAVARELRSLLLSREKKDTPKRRRPRSEDLSLVSAIAWLDEEPWRWDSFFEAVEWRPGEGSLLEILHRIKDELSSRSDTRDLANDLTMRLVAEVLLASSQPEVEKRIRDRRDLLLFIKNARKELSGWRSSDDATNLRAVLDESIEIGESLLDVSRDFNPDAVRSSPGKLLSAYYEVVPFNTESRHKELSLLADWCGRETPRSVWLLYGDGGSGKTRLLLEWCQRLAHNGWHAGFLDAEAAASSPELPKALLRGIVPRLIVVDYAEQHPDTAQRLVKQLSLCQTSPKVRLVLLARRIPDWWRKLSARTEFIDDLLSPAVSPEPLRLAPLFSPGPARAEALTQAMLIFAEALHRELPLGDLAVDLDRPLFNNALFLYMEALAIIYGDAPDRRRDLLEAILRHERRYWQKEIEALDLERLRREALENAIGPLIAAVTLLGEVSLPGTGIDLVGSVTDGSLQAFDLVVPVLQLLKRICGNSTGALAALQPDLLGEQLIEEVLRERAGDGEPYLLTRVFEGARDTKALLNAAKASMRLLLRRGSVTNPAIGDRRLEQGLRWLNLGGNCATGV